MGTVFLCGKFPLGSPCGPLDEASPHLRLPFSKDSSGCFMICTSLSRPSRAPPPPPTQLRQHCTPPEHTFGAPSSGSPVAAAPSTFAPSSPVSMSLPSSLLVSVSLSVSVSSSPSSSLSSPPSSPSPLSSPSLPSASLLHRGHGGGRLLPFANRPPLSQPTRPPTHPPAQTAKTVRRQKKKETY